MNIESKLTSYNWINMIVEKDGEIKTFKIGILTGFFITVVLTIIVTLIK